MKTTGLHNNHSQQVSRVNWPIIATLLVALLKLLGKILTVSYPILRR